MRPPDRPPIVVVGGGLAGLAAAARLAKQGHPVQLLESAGALGGAWAPFPLGHLTVDAAPAVIGFPAPWRDLLRKSGRPLEAELTRCGRQLVPAPAPAYRFADGTELVLPSDRGGQFDALRSRYGEAPAVWWRDLLDSLEATWQALRPLGLEAEPAGRGSLAQAARRLRPWGTLADLAAAAPHPHLSALIRSVAHRLGSPPEVTPGWCAVELWIARTFGRWSVDNGRTSVLVDVLTERLGLRKVRVHPNTTVTAIRLAAGRVEAVATADGRTFPAAAVICTVDPWQLTERLLPPPARGRLRRDVAPLRPARAPVVTHRRRGDHHQPLAERIDLDEAGVPVITFQRPGIDVVHDYRAAVPDPSWGPAWRRRRDLLRRVPVSTEVPGLFLAGASTPAGNGPSQVLQSGALASYACHDYAERSGFSPVRND